MLSENLEYKFEKKKGILLFFAFAGGFLSGLFGSGGGILLLLPLLKIFGKEHSKEAFALSSALLFEMSLLSFFLYRREIPFRFEEFSLIPFLISAVAGGFFGAILLGKWKDQSIRKLFSILLILGGLILFFKNIISLLS